MLAQGNNYLGRNFGQQLERVLYGAVSVLGGQSRLGLIDTQVIAALVFGGEVKPIIAGVGLDVHRKISSILNAV